MMLSALGPPGCGKSALAEAMCLRICRRMRWRPAYLATLPESTIYATRIQRHRARRSARWTVHRLNLLQAPDVLAELDRLARRGGCLLLDGVTPLFLSQVVVYNRMDAELEDFAAAMLRILRAPTARCVWIVVDTLTPDVNDVGNLGPLLAGFHAGLAACGPMIRFDER